MKTTYSNFTYIGTKVTADLDRIFDAEICEITTTGVWIWKNCVIKIRRIRRVVGQPWFFIDDGTFCPSIVDDLAQWFSSITGIEF